MKITQTFDHDEPSREKEAYITVRASDNGQPQLDDACTIKILIEDVNDNPPVFDKVVSINYTVTSTIDSQNEMFFTPKTRNLQGQKISPA